MPLETELSEISMEIEGLARELDHVLADLGPKAQSLRERLTAGIDQARIADALSLAFVGPSGAGKSSLISALTGDRSIPIGGDITTERTHPYPWHGVHLVDTPGLWTERTEHDTRTMEMLQRAGLIVFCLTCNLFDEVALQNFRELAIARQFSPKLFLIVNKLSAEHGPRDERLANYRDSINDMISPMSLHVFPHAFVDARDFLDGVDDEDDALCVRSNMADLVARLNDFIRARGILGALDAPLRLIQQGLTEAATLVSRDGNADDAFMLLLRQIESELSDVRASMRAEVLEIRRDGVRSIREAGQALVAALIAGTDVEEKAAEAQSKVHKTTEWVAERIQKSITQHGERLQQAVNQILGSEAAARISVEVTRPEANMDDTQRSGSSTGFESWNRLLSLASDAAERLRDGARGPSAGAAGGLFLKAGEAAGGNLHQFVYDAGKLLGHNFKPWEAVNLAKNAGNAAQVAGVGLAVFRAAVRHVPGSQAIRARQRRSQASFASSSKLRKARRPHLNAFCEAARRLCRAQMLGPVSAKLSELRAARLREKALTSAFG